LFVIKTHYRSPIDYDEKAILQTKRELERLDEFVLKLQNLTKKPPIQKIRGRVNFVWQRKKEFKEFDKGMEDDFNTPKAIAVVFDLVNKGNILISQNKLSPTEAKEILNVLKKVDKVFNFIFWQKPKEKIPGEILKLVKERESYRKSGQWQKADELRKKIKELGYWVEDTKEGPKIKKV